MNALAENGRLLKQAQQYAARYTGRPISAGRFIALRAN
jgi:hypothetical protein